MPNPPGIRASGWVRSMLALLFVFSTGTGYCIYFLHQQNLVLQEQNLRLIENQKSQQTELVALTSYANKNFSSLDSRVSITEANVYQVKAKLAPVKEFAVNGEIVMPIAESQ